VKARNCLGDADKSNDAEGAIAEAEGKEAQVKVELCNYQLEQAIIRAPMDGVILAGDLEDKQGSKVELGKELFQVGEADALRAEVNVNERDIQLVKVGQKGQIATRSEPRNRIDVTVERVVPLGDVKEGSNTFRVYAKLDKPADPSWLPGMIGEARLDDQPRTLIWTWTHRLIDWVRIKTWM
jgi:multidrug efflux pump subunit AcrA (membrane-fusion protein)